MILSASRRTDIPAFYSDWFFNRIKEGYLYVRNPMNAHQISKIELTPELVDCIVFWTKNPAPMLDRLDELKDYKYYFQFTLTGYGRDIEECVPNKTKTLIPIFKELSHKIGKEKVIWRYDPIILNEKYTKDYHLRAFRSIATELREYTDKVVISFVDVYDKNKKNLKEIKNVELDNDVDIINEVAKEMSKIAHDNNIVISTCAEAVDLEKYGIEHNHCIDKELIEKIIGWKLKAKKDKNQRMECGCVESVEIGTYNTCKHNCKYCYANYSKESVINNSKQYDPNSPLLCGVVNANDKITTRKVKSLKDSPLSDNMYYQPSLFE